VNNLAYIGAAVLTVITIGMVFINRKRIVAEEKAQS
jgi:PTS system galactitol-specific IIC component